MRIDWKRVSQSPGYISLKTAYIKDIRKKKSFHTKEELTAKFQWVINRAKHYAYMRGVPLEHILNQWEERRDYWWINFYQPMNQPKLRWKNSLEPRKRKPTGNKLPPRWNSRTREYLAQRSL